MMVGEILMRGGTSEKSPGMTKEIYKKMRNRVNTILRSKLGHCFIFVKMKFPDDFAADGVHVADSTLWKHAVQIRRALLLLQRH